MDDQQREAEQEERETDKDEREAEQEDSPPVMEPEDDDASLGDHARELRREFSPAKANEKLEEVVKEKPLLDHLLDLGIVARAVAIAAVVALILWLLIGPGSAAIALVVVFAGAWYGLAQRSYNKRRPTKAADRDEDEDEEDEEDDDGPERYTGTFDSP
jgi:Flp pilus assembly protein TadB